MDLAGNLLVWFSNEEQGEALLSFQQLPPTSLWGHQAQALELTVSVPCP